MAYCFFCLLFSVRMLKEHEKSTCFSFHSPPFPQAEIRMLPKSIWQFSIRPRAEGMTVSSTMVGVHMYMHVCMYIATQSSWFISWPDSHLKPSVLLNYNRLYPCIMFCQNQAGYSLAQCIHPVTSFWNT